MGKREPVTDTLNQRPDSVSGSGPTKGGDAVSRSYQIDVDLELLKKYNHPGPRYTSYPTVPHFHESFTSQDFYRAVVAANQGNSLADISLYFHFPFCRTLCYFCACNMIITHSERRIQHYLECLKKEIDLMGRLMNPARKVIQMHWGGGTPTYLTPRQITDTFGYIRDRFNFSDTAEMSIEIDPRTITPEHLPVIRENGFNRISFGVQDFNPVVQKAINRIQSDEQNAFMIDEGRRLGFDSINMDLMYGLPYQTVESYEKTLDSVIELSPDRLAVFNYAHVPWMKKHQRLLPQEAMPDTVERLRILKQVIERLTGAGYVYIGMDHFAKPDDDLALALEKKTLYRNFQGYSTCANAEVYALGATSISQLHNVYAQNAKDIKTYAQRLNEGILPTLIGIELNDDDRLRRHVITEIMCNSRILKEEVQRRFEIDFDGYFSDALARLEPFIEDGLVSLLPDRIQVHDIGRLAVRNIAMVFDAYLPADQQQQKPIYSRTV